MKLITILTPTYNRANTLKSLYESLVKQTNLNFTWLVVDDGSNDDTSKLIKSFISEKKIEIKYVFKENGGKHTAINEGVKHIKTPLTMIVDSDDVIVPDAIKIILDDYSTKWEDNSKIGSASYLKGNMSGEVIGNKFPDDLHVSNHINYRINGEIKEDKAEVFRTDILKQYPFPKIAGENFLSECIIWNRIAKTYDTLYINNLIYLCDYRTDGLTKNWRIVNFRNPRGASLVANEMTTAEFSLKIRIRNTILYVLYGKFAKYSFKKLYCQSLCKSLYILLYPLGLLAYFIYYFKYKKQVVR